MKQEELYQQRLVELKPLIMCLQTSLELFGREATEKLAQITLEKYAHDRFVKQYDGIALDERWRIFRGNIVKYSDGYGYELIEQDEHVIKIKYHWCSFYEIFKDFGLADFVKMYCDTDYTTCRQIHPGINMTRTKILAAGDNCCDHCWTYTP